MTTRSSLFFALTAATLFSTPAPAADGAKPVVGVGGTLFAHYGYDLTDGAEGANAFDLDRLYVEAKSNLEGPFAFRFTLDVGRQKEQVLTLPDGSVVKVPEDTKIGVFVKYAYLEYKTPIDGVKVRAGVAPTPYVGFYDGFWGHRFITKAFTDEYKALSSADIGVHLVGSHADKLIDWQFAAINGEGYGSPEADAGKTGQLRLTVDPLKDGDSGSLPITGFISYEGVPDGDPVIVYAGALGYDMKYLLAWAEYVGQMQGDASAMGVSGTVMGKVPDIINVFGRVDRWDGDTETDDDAEMRIIGGISRELIPGSFLAATYERTTVEVAPDLPEHGVFVRMQARY